MYVVIGGQQTHANQLVAGWAERRMERGEGREAEVAEGVGGSRGCQSVERAHARTRVWGRQSTRGVTIEVWGDLLLLMNCELPGDKRWTASHHITLHQMRVLYIINGFLSRCEDDPS